MKWHSIPLGVLFYSFGIFMLDGQCVSDDISDGVLSIASKQGSNFILMLYKVKQFILGVASCPLTFLHTKVYEKWYH